MRIGYYFGAGISLETIPLADKLPDRIISLSQLIGQNIPGNLANERYEQSNSKFNNTTYKELIELMCDEWRKVSTEAKGVTIDTYAKENIFNELELNLCKAVLSSYFLLEQYKVFPFPVISYAEKISPRVRKFVSDIIEYSGDPMRLRNNPVILTWNYDMQIELAMKNHLKDLYPGNEISYSKRLLNVWPRYSQVYGDLPGHIVVKINGTAGYSKPKENHRPPVFAGTDIQSQNYEIFLSNVVKHFIYAYEDLNHNATEIKFAFEDLKLLKDYGHYIEQYLNTIDRLYVMGYSFSAVNDEADKLYLSKMKNLSEVEIFDLPENESSLVEKFRIRSNNDKLKVSFNPGVNSIPVYG